MYDPDELTQWTGERTRVVDLDGPGPTDPFLDDQATLQEAVHFAHDRGLIDADRPGEIRQGPGPARTEEKLDEEFTLGVGSENWKDTRDDVLHKTQYNLQFAHIKRQAAALDPKNLENHAPHEVIRYSDHVAQLAIMRWNRPPGSAANSYSAVRLGHKTTRRSKCPGKPNTHHGHC